MKLVSTARRYLVFWMIIAPVLIALAALPPAAFARVSAEPLAATSPGGGLATHAGATASGTWGTCAWEITSGGALKIGPGEAGNVYAASWRGWANDITSISAPVQGGKKIVCTDSMDYTFTALPKLKSADLSGFDTSRVTSMRSLFNSCEALTSVNLSGWTTKRVTDMADMFGGCTSLASLNLKAFNTSSVRTMDGMFTSCRALKTLDLSSFSTGRVESTRSMFASCTSLKTLDLSRFSTSAVTRCDNMFSNCAKLNELKVGTGYAIKSDAMFPAATARTGMWWSTEKKAWVPVSSIASNRSGKADTYLASGKEVGKAPLAAAEITLSQYRYTYNGAKRMPQVTVTMYGQTLKFGTDYSITYTGCRSAGRAHATVKGKGLFAGSKTVSYTIAPAPISEASFDPVKDATYTGKAMRPALKATFNGSKLGANDFAATYKDNVKAGKATITAKGKGNFTGTKAITFKIKPASIKKTKASKIKARTYTGKPIKPGVALTLKGVQLGKSDYSLSYANNEDVGGATVTIAGKGNFKDVKKVMFKIVKASIAGARIAKIGEVPYTGKAAKPAPTVTWKGMTLRAGSDYSTSYKNNKKPGTATVVMKGAGNFKGKVSATFEIGKPENPMTVKATALSVAWNEVRDGAKTLSPLTVSNAAGEVTYAVVAKNAALSFNAKTGKLTVLKGTGPGTYTMKVKVSAAGSKKYAAASKTVELSVTVRGTFKKNEEETNDRLIDANYLMVGTDMFGTVSSQSDQDWFAVDVRKAGYYKLQIWLDDYVEMYGGNLHADFYANRDTLASTKKYVAVYVSDEQKTATTASMYLPEGTSYVCVGGGVAWPGTFSYHIRVLAG